jgi:carbon-monoxide dehydrogenase large subunit
VKGVVTNTIPVDAYRGAGRPEATYVVERLVDVGGAELGSTGRDPPAQHDRASQFPYQTPVICKYDSGN